MLCCFVFVWLGSPNEFNDDNANVHNINNDNSLNNNNNVNNTNDVHPVIYMFFNTSYSSENGTVNTPNVIGDEGRSWSKTKEYHSDILLILI